MAARCMHGERRKVELYDQEEDTRSLHTCFFFPLESVLYVSEPPYSMQIRREAK